MKGDWEKFRNILPVDALKGYVEKQQDRKIET